MGEGSGILVLEEREQAQQRELHLRRGRRLRMTGDAFHMTMPDPEAQGVARCIKMALADAGVRPEEVEYINAHGTSTPYNDKHETLAIKRLWRACLPPRGEFDQIDDRPPAGSRGRDRSYLYCLGYLHGILPPTINYEHPDAECDLDYVPHLPGIKR